MNGLMVWWLTATDVDLHATHQGKYKRLLGNRGSRPSLPEGLALIGESAMPTWAVSVPVSRQLSPCHVSKKHPAFLLFI